MPFKNKEDRVKWSATYHLKHKKEKNAKSAAYYNKHKNAKRGEKAVQDAKYRATHRKEINTHASKFYLIHKKEIDKRHTIYRENHKIEATIYRATHRPEKAACARRRYKTVDGKLLCKKHAAKRRKLGFLPINHSFEGNNGHHLTKNIIVYIPSFLHTSVSHNIFTGRNMKKINLKVMEWLLGVWKE